MDATEGSYRTLVSVNGTEDDEKKSNGVEMKNLLEDDDEPQVHPSGMKRSETADLLNLTLHQVTHHEPP
jgi:hypothetical protein